MKVDYEDYLFYKNKHIIIDPKGYALRSLPRNKKEHRKVRVHREIMNAPEDVQIDHINGDKLDNRRCNLRFATGSQNQHNRIKYKTNTTGYKGVVRHGKKFRAVITAHGTKHNLGTYDTPEKAAVMYNLAAIKYHGAFLTLIKLRALTIARFALKRYN
jgi:predicted DNA binding protein